MQGLENVMRLTHIIKTCLLTTFESFLAKVFNITFCVSTIIKMIYSLLDVEKYFSYSMNYCLRISTGHFETGNQYLSAFTKFRYSFSRPTKTSERGNDFCRKLSSKQFFTDSLDLIIPIPCSANIQHN